MLTNCTEIGVRLYLECSGLKMRSGGGGVGIRREIFADAANEKWYVTYASVARSRDRKLSITRNKRRWYIFILRRARSANSRNFARITCTAVAMALSGHGRRSAINHSRKSRGVYSGRGIEEKASLHGLPTKPETNDRLIYYRGTCSEHVRGDGTIANNNTCNPSVVKINYANGTLIILPEVNRT